jgi:hypothetical protein
MDPDLKNETRRPVLVKIAKARGIAVPANFTVNEIKELLMTKSAAPKPPPKPAPKAAPAAPPKPGAPKPAPKAAPAAPPKPGAPKPAPKAAPAAPPKAAPAAPPKPGAPKAAPAAPAKPAAGVSAQDFTAFQAVVASAFEAFNRRITQLELSFTGFGPFASVGEDGAVVLDVDNADRASLRFWAHKFGVGDPAADTESIRKALKKARAAKDFAGWTVVNDTEPDAEEGSEEPDAEEPAAEEPAAEEEAEEEVSLEQIEAMNLTELVALAKNAGIEYKDVAKQPKALRARIIEALTAAAGEEEEEAEAEALAEGQAVNVVAEGETYPATFQGYDADGDAIIIFDGQEEAQAYPPDAVTAA